MPSSARSWPLFAGAVLIWGTTWHAIVYQLEQTTPEFGVAARFTLAGTLALAWAAWRGKRLRFGLRPHALLALQGVFMYSLAYVCVYHAERHIPSGLVAVGYSASPLVLGVAARLLWGTPMTGLYALGGVIGVIGVALMFAPEIASMSGADAAASIFGAVMTAAAVALSAVGNLAAAKNPQQGIAVEAALGWGMLYGAAASWSVVLLSAQPLVWPSGWGWWLSYLYLGVFGSVVAFACYLWLQLRIGTGPASSVGVATPVIALAVSTALEGYQPTWLTLAGIVLALAGNALALGLRWPMSRSARPGVQAPTAPDQTLPRRAGP